MKIHVRLIRFVAANERTRLTNLYKTNIYHHHPAVISRRDIGDTWRFLSNQIRMYICIYTLIMSAMRRNEFAL